jgi:hypothetical protein
MHGIVVTKIQHRARRALVDLHHVLPTQDLEVAEEAPVHVRRHGPHPPLVRGGATALVLAVLLSSSTFWAFLWWDDGVRRTFFPRRGPGDLVLGALFLWGFLTQVAGPLRLVHHLQLKGRLRIALSLRLVACWVVTGLATVAWWIAGTTISGWFALLAGILLIPAVLVFQLARAAVAADA